MKPFAALALALALTVPSAAAARPDPERLAYPATLVETNVALTLRGTALSASRLTRDLPDGRFTLALEGPRAADLDGDGRPELVVAVRERLCPPAGGECREALHVDVWTRRTPGAALALAAVHDLPPEARLDGFDLLGGEVTVYHTLPAPGGDADDAVLTYTEETFAFDGRRLTPVGVPWRQVLDPADGC